MTTPTLSQVGKTGYNQVTIPKFSPEKQQLFSQVMGGIKPGLTNSIDQLSRLASGGTPEMWEQLESPALKQFGALQGNIASRFSGMGSGARRSSGFQNTMNTAAEDLSQKLQSQRLGLQQDSISQLMKLFGDLMGTEEFDTTFIPNKPKKKSFAEEFFGSMSSGISKGIGMLPSLAFF